MTKQEYKAIKEELKDIRKEMANLIERIMAIECVINLLTTDEERKEE